MERREQYAHVRSKSRYLAFTEPPLLKWSCQPERIEPDNESCAVTELKSHSNHYFSALAEKPMGRAVI